MGKPKYKAVIKPTPNGYELDLYKRWLWFWEWQAGMYPTFENSKEINERLNRWKKMYGDNLVVKDCRNA